MLLNLLVYKHCAQSIFDPIHLRIVRMLNKRDGEGASVKRKAEEEVEDEEEEEKEPIFDH